MRKRHQAILISSQAKKKICNELSINNASYEIEQKQMLNNYFKDHIDDEDVEVQTKNQKNEDNIQSKGKDNKDEEEEENEYEEDLEDEEEENITLSTNIAVPPLGDQKGPYIKYEISEKAFVGGINFDDYSYIPERTLKIKGDNEEEQKDEINDIQNQMERNEINDDELQNENYDLDVDNLAEANSDNENKNIPEKQENNDENQNNNMELNSQNRHRPTFNKIMTQKITDIIDNVKTFPEGNLESWNFVADYNP